MRSWDCLLPNRTLQQETVIFRYTVPLRAASACLGLLTHATSAVLVEVRLRPHCFARARAIPPAFASSRPTSTLPLSPTWYKNTRFISCFPFSISAYCKTTFSQQMPVSLSRLIRSINVINLRGEIKNRSNVELAIRTLWFRCYCVFIRSCFEWNM